MLEIIKGFEWIGDFLMKIVMIVNALKRKWKHVQLHFQKGLR